MTHLHENKSPRERIVSTARELFLRQGFAGTPVNQLIDLSDTHKASFYRHFEGKEDVAVEYLKAEGETFLAALEMLLGRARDAPDFVRRWCRLLRKQVRSGQFHGCRVSRLIQTLEKEHESLETLSAEILDAWIKALAVYLAGRREAGGFQGDPARTAEKFIRLFQGTAAMYRLHGRAEVFAYLEQDLLAEVGA